MSTTEMAIYYLAVGAILAELFRHWTEARPIAEGTIIAGYVLIIIAWPMVLVASTIAAFVANKEN